MALTFEQAYDMLSARAPACSLADAREHIARLVDEAAQIDPAWDSPDLPLWRRALLLSDVRDNIPDKKIPAIRNLRAHMQELHGPDHPDVSLKACKAAIEQAEQRDPELREKYDEWKRASARGY